ncbi:hypothetical protein LZF95_21000 [Algoriphagus sp. AGSA1]|uniref:hypothetical protein n=1 Tax=Algoriphagus sp. AGSA1 TaxID=2907213 RepID=UPI001F21983F|nr:hypothetical protein [Algoriphagus sp. AGSA1]MCE7057172.1 hypothetical protein [Algoriphagus sp. AGSA1]
MRLVLHRKYRASVTLGRLFLGKQQLCFTREPPRACFGTVYQSIQEELSEAPSRLGPCLHGPISCLEEGVYELEPIHSEEKGWEIGIGDKGKICGYAGEEKLESCSIYPVTCYRADGTPLFTKLAFLKLMGRLEREWERGEVVELQVISEGIPYLLESCLEQSFY